MQTATHYRLKSLLIKILMLPLLIMLALYLLQEKMIFFPQPHNAVNEQKLAALSNVEPLTLKAETAIELHGWLVKSKLSNNAQTTPVVIYFGGNGDELSWMALEPKLPQQANWIFLNYRGYGQSQGAPSEQALFADALLTYDELVKAKDYKPEQIVVMGRSLGTGVAVYLASMRAVNRIVLITPYDSVREIAQSKFRWLPIAWLLKHPFDSYSRAQNLHHEVAFIVASDDQTIPMSHTQRLYDKWAGPKQWHLIKAQHNNIFEPRETWRIIEAFINPR